MSAGFWLFAAFALVGAGSWLVEYHWQRDRYYKGLTVRPPRVVIWLCGNPRRDGTIDLEAAVRQLSALAFLLGAPAVSLLPLDLSRRAGLIFLIYAIISVPGFFLGEWLRWRRTQELAREIDGTEARPHARTVGRVS